MILNAGLSKNFNPKSVKTLFVLPGYSIAQKGYGLYDENKRKIFIRRDVIFNKTEFGGTNRVQLEVEEENDKCSEEE